MFASLSCLINTTFPPAPCITRCNSIVSTKFSGATKKCLPAARQIASTATDARAEQPATVGRAMGRGRSYDRRYRLLSGASGDGCTVDLDNGSKTLSPGRGRVMTIDRDEWTRFAAEQSTSGRGGTAEREREKGREKSTRNLGSTRLGTEDTTNRVVGSLRYAVTKAPIFPSRPRVVHQI